MYNPDHSLILGKVSARDCAPQLIQLVKALALAVQDWGSTSV